MAKEETKIGEPLPVIPKKSKAQKRKHASKENDEEVASKSLIVEAEEGFVADDNPTNALKRKQKGGGDIREKRTKYATGDYAAENEDNAGEEQHEPTLDELLESEKPENGNAIVTVRQKKKQKHMQRVESLKDKTADKERLRNEEYLCRWKHSRAEWKFEKLRQVSIQQTIFNEMKISQQFWPIALEYLSGSKGAAKAHIISLAEQCIDELDKQCAQQTSEQERHTIIESPR